MIRIYSSNSVEILERILLEMVRSERRQPAAGPLAAFRRTRLIIPNEAVRDELMRAFADDAGIASGLDAMTLTSWLDPQTGAIWGTSSIGHELEWLIWLLLQNESFIGRPECARLQRYVENRTTAEYAQLARRIAYLFTTYVSYRLDWVLDWMRADSLASDDILRADNPRRAREACVLAAHPDAPWQKAMWHVIANGTLDGETICPVWVGADAIRAIPSVFAKGMEAEYDGSTATHIFLPSAVPPLALPFLMSEAKRNDVSIYLMNPSRVYWFDPEAYLGEDRFEWIGEDMPSRQGFGWFRKNAAPARALIERVWTFAGEAPQTESLVEDDYMRRVNPADPRGRTFEELDPSMLLELRSEDALDAVSVFHDPCADEENPTLLHRLQRAVLEDDDAEMPDALDENDHSISIVKSPTALREVEAVFDWIQHLLDDARKRGVTLRADDILVVTPDIDAYAPVIAAAHQARAGASVAFRIAGQTEFEGDDLAQAVIATGKFLFSRATREDFEDLISCESVAASRFRTTPDFRLVRQWLASAGYRWGLNEAHARRCVEAGLAMPEDDAGGDFEGTLDRALERLVTGFYSAPGHTVTVGDVLPMLGTEAQGWESSAVTEHAALLDDIIDYAGALCEVRASVPQDETDTLAGWCGRTKDWIRRLFGAALNTPGMNDFKERLQALEVIAGRVLHDRPIGFDVFWDALTAMLRDRKSMARATGCVTFSGMECFRRIPYKAIAMIGMDAGQAFPGQNRSEEFDLMRAEAEIDGKTVSVRRRGDGDSRASNRNVFLDLLLSARESVLISYCTGMKTVEAVPSVVVQELRRLLAKHLTPEVVESRLTVTLPMSAYRPENFRETQEPVRSRSRTALDAYAEGRARNFLAVRPLFIGGSAVAPRGEAHRRLTATALAKLISDPGAWLEKQTRVNALEDEETPDVPLALDAKDGLVRWKIADACTKAVAADMSDAQILRRAACNPSLGAKPLREAATRPLLQKVHMQQGALETLKAGWLESEMLEGGVLTYEGAGYGYFDEIGVSEIRVYRGAEEDSAPVYPVILTSSSHEQRLIMQFLVHIALGHDVDFLLIGMKDATTLELTRLSARTAGLSDAREAAKAVLGEWLRAVNRHSERAPSLWRNPFAKSPKDVPYSLVLPFGAFRDALTEAEKKLRDAYDNFTGLFKVKDPGDKNSSGSKKTAKTDATPDETAYRLRQAFRGWERAVKDAEAARGEAA